MKKLLRYTLLVTGLITSCNAAENPPFDTVKQAIAILSQAPDDNSTAEELKLFKEINQELNTGIYTQYAFKKEDNNTVSLLIAPADAQTIDPTQIRNYKLTQDQFEALETIITNLSALQTRSGNNRSAKRPAMQTTETQTDVPAQTTTQQESPTSQPVSEPSSSRSYRDDDDDDDYYKRRRVPYIPASEIEKDKEKETENIQDNPALPGAKTGMGKSQSPTSGMKKSGMNQPQRSPYGPQPSYYRPMPRSSFGGGPRESLQPRAVGGQVGNQTAHVKTQPIKKLKDVTQEERNAIIPEGSVRIAQHESGTPEPEYSMPKRITASPQTVEHERRTARKSGLIPRYPSINSGQAQQLEIQQTPKTQSWSITNWFTNLWNKITSWFGVSNNE